MKKALLFTALLALSFSPLPAQDVTAEQSPKVGGLQTEVITDPTPEPEAPPTTKRPRALPFRSVVHSIDEEHRAYFRMGKTRLRRVHIQPDTRFLLASGEPATAEDLRVGIDIRGSYRKRDDGDYDAVTIKIGAKERQ